VDSDLSVGSQAKKIAGAADRIGRPLPADELFARRWRKRRELTDVGEPLTEKRQFERAWFRKATQVLLALECAQPRDHH